MPKLNLEIKEMIKYIPRTSIIKKGIRLETERPVFLSKKNKNRKDGLCINDVLVNGIDRELLSTAFRIKK